MKRGRGYVLITGPDGDKVDGDTLRCMHCSKMWIVRKGSGIERGWCMNCDGPTCGGRGCRECVHFMKKIEQIEAAGRRNQLFERLGA